VQVRTLAYDYPDGHRIGFHRHDWHQLVHASGGVMTLRTATDAWVVPPHRAVWVPADVDHAIEMSGRVAMRTLYVRPRAHPGFPRQCRALAAPPLLRELVVYAVQVGTLDARRDHQRHVLALLFDLLAALPGEAAHHLPRPRDARAAAIAQVLESDPADARPLPQLARAAGASARTAERLFHAETGMTFRTWRQQLRLVHGMRLLAGGHSVTSVALDTGYLSPSAFVSAFRLTFGQTPGRYFGAVAAPTAPWTERDRAWLVGATHQRLCPKRRASRIMGERRS
jgi:AraC-like DNA-binding protein